jgi:hypothetical protein
MYFFTNIYRIIAQQLHIKYLVLDLRTMLGLYSTHFRPPLYPLLSPGVASIHEEVYLWAIHSCLRSYYQYINTDRREEGGGECGVQKTVSPIDVNRFHNILPKRDERGFCNPPPQSPPPLLSPLTACTRDSFLDSCFCKHFATYLKEKSCRMYKE